MATKKVTAPATEAPAQEEVTIKSKDAPEQVMSYRDALKLVAGILRANPNNGGADVVECIRDVVAATGLDVNYEPQEEDQEEAAE